MCGSCADDVRGCLRVGFVFLENEFSITQPPNLYGASPFACFSGMCPCLVVGGGVAVCKLLLPLPIVVGWGCRCLQVFVACDPALLWAGASLFVGLCGLCPSFVVGWGVPVCMFCGLACASALLLAGFACFYCLCPGLGEDWGVAICMLFWPAPQLLLWAGALPFAGFVGLCPSIVVGWGVADCRLVWPVPLPCCGLGRRCLHDFLACGPALLQAGASLFAGVSCLWPSSLVLKFTPNLFHG
jgi:hypothetical protein